jgi:hypothetical protein
MSNTLGYDEVLAEFQAGRAGSGLPCAQVRALLMALGFHVKDGSRGGHKTVTHPDLPDFYSTAYNCRGGNGVVDRNYLRTLIRVLKDNKDAIENFLGHQ